MSYRITVLLMLLFMTGSLFAQTQTPATPAAPAKTATLAASAAADDAPSSTYGSIVGRVVSEDGPLAFVQVTILPVSNRNRGNSLRMATTDAEGNFKVDGLRAMAWNIIASAQGYVAELADEENPQTFYRIGEQATIRMTRGGVITGRVISPGGEPLIAVPVAAQMVRDAKGQPASVGTGSGLFQTDDRGIYRIYGLAPGTYIVNAGRASGGVGGPGGGGGRFSPYEGNVPVYFPSATRDTAIEVSVSSGGETGGIDIQYRGDKGFAVSGKITGAVAENSRGFGGGLGGGIGVTLMHVASGTVLNRTFVMSRNGANVYALNGVPNGEYEVSAQRNAPGENSAASAPRRITVSGRDVIGIDLMLLPLASVTGQLQIENDANQLKCEPKRKAALEEQLFVLQTENAMQTTARPNAANALFGFGMNDGNRPVAPNRAGEFVFRDLANGNYRLTPKLLDEKLYLRSMTMPGAVVKVAAKTVAKPTILDVARNGLTLKSGEKLTGLVVKAAEGAAAFGGKIKSANNAPLSPNLHVYLIPTERERLDDVLRYSVGTANQEGAFQLTNLAPGKYWVLVSSEAATEKNKFWLPADRAKLRRLAESLNQMVELTACQRLVNYELQFK